MRIEKIISNLNRNSKLLRVFDVVFALILLVVFSPIMLLTALAIMVDSSGPIFADIPERVGKNGRLFRLFKFRSMIPGAQKLLMTDPRLKRLFKEYKKNSFKLKADPRITRVGVFIRKHSIDEFPQLFNVLLGEMSLVGPRPYYQFELQEQLKIYPEVKSAIKKMQTVAPGITGEWQVAGRSEVDFDKRILLDANYVKKKSLVYDFYILLRTPWVVITGKGAY